MAEKEIKTLELETLFMSVNAVLCEYGPKKWAKPHLKVFLRKSLNFRTKTENFLTLKTFLMIWLATVHGSFLS